MKFNLKNRPQRDLGQIEFDWYWVNPHGEIQSEQDVNNWFLGFEKELRDLLTLNCQDYHAFCVKFAGRKGNTLTEDLLREILGE